jgi:thiamine biosynthesis lipoprotein
LKRRDFLHARHLAQTAGQVAGAVADLDEVPGSEVPLVRMARKAMATSFVLFVPLGTPDVTALGTVIFDRIDELEDQLSVYRPASEICRINRLASYQAVPVEPHLFGLLSLAAKLSAETEGAFDATAGALIKAWGFFRGPRRVPEEMERKQALERVGMRHVVLAAESRSVRFLRPGLEFNLGAIGKGYALDRVVAMLEEQGELPAALVHGGSSSLFACGHPPGDRRGWLISVRHPWEDRRLALLHLRNRALGTSAATYQHLEYNGRKLGHVLDPRSGWPAEGMASVSVVAPTAAEADALSTAFFVGGLGLANRYCASHPEVGAILLPTGPAAAPAVLGLTPDECILGPAIV